MNPLSKEVMSLTMQRGSSLSKCMAEGSALLTRISIMASMGGNLNQLYKVKHRLSYLRLGIGLQSLQKIANGVVDQVQTALALNVQSGLASAFLEHGANVLHEFVKVEIDANGTLEHFKEILLE